MMSKRATMGKTMVFMITLLFLIVFMGLSIIYFSGAGAFKKNVENPDFIYEIDSNNVIFKDINVSENQVLLMDAMLIDFEKRKLSHGDFSDEVQKGIIEMMQKDNDFKNIESCLLIKISDEKAGQLSESEEGVSMLTNFFRKDNDGKVNEELMTTPFSSFKIISQLTSHSNIMKDNRVIVFSSYYGECV